MDSVLCEDRLADALEQLLEQGAEDLDGLSSGLNSLGISSPEGRQWTAASLEAEFKRLAA